MEKQELRQAYKQSERVQDLHREYTAANTRSGVECPNCGAINDSAATFCENCGHAIGLKQCPYCRTPLMPDADICEKCHRYVLDEICSFCGSVIGTDDLFCPECGMSREGIICPVCHTPNKFSICVNCGTPLTDSAREELMELRQTPAYQQMRQLSRELEKLERQTVATTEEQKERRERCKDIRRRVLALLNEQPLLFEHAENEEESNSSELTVEELAAMIQKKRMELQSVLNSMASKTQTSAAVTRRYVLARKPPLTRLGWRCNYKNELHHGPQECACPQKGGTWIAIDGKQETELNAKK